METVVIVSTDDLGDAEPAREGGTAPVVLQPGEKRLVYLCALLTLLSFFVIPFLANLPLLFKLSKSRWQLFLMLLTLGAADAVVGMVVLVTRLV